MNQYVLNANILFSGVISQKVVYRTLFGDWGNVFYTPDFVLAELNNYHSVFLKRSTVKGVDLKEFTLFLLFKIIVVPDYVITPESYRIAEELVADIGPKDVAYVALNEELGATVLTRDKALHDGLRTKGYSRIKLFNEFLSQQLSESGREGQ
ncbi:PIN domain-containing protein [Spirosoma rigui]|uniref:PIN domain-containing protein n=1 Tax=Spirosoma rigui TaxID=564064 RepID=UPI0009B1549E|nr:PIN domain-containing protein [Spirosoma rigui]